MADPTLYVSGDRVRLLKDAGGAYKGDVGVVRHGGRGTTDRGIDVEVRGKRWTVPHDALERLPEAPPEKQGRLF